MTATPEEFIVALQTCTTLILNLIVSDSEDEEILNILLRQTKCPQSQPVRLEMFVERIIPGYSCAEFQSHFRLTRQSFDWLVRHLTPDLQNQPFTVGRQRISIERQILVVLWILATPDSYRSISVKFNMGKSSIHKCFIRVINSLNNLASQIINWPTPEQWTTIKRKFKAFAGLDNVLGAIDGTYVSIKAPQQDAEVYINRKSFHGITLEAIGTPNLNFVDCFVGFPSSVNDARIFRNSPIFTAFMHNNRQYFEGEEYIIGDKAYPLNVWCILPYIQRGHLEPQHVHFNTIHARTRQCIERCFALLFGRWRRLQHLDMSRTDLTPATIIAACVIHNVCLLTPDAMLEEYIQVGENFVGENREEVDQNVNLYNVGNAAEHKRNALAAAAYAK